MQVIFILVFALEKNEVFGASRNDLIKYCKINDFFILHIEI